MDGGQIKVELEAIGRIKFKAIVEPSDSPIDDPSYEPSIVKYLKQAERKYPIWGWCDITIVAYVEGIDAIKGEAHLGGSSFKNEKDFLKSKANNYLSDLRQEAFDELWEMLEEIQKLMPSANEIEAAKGKLQLDRTNS